MAGHNIRRDFKSMPAKLNGKRELNNGECLAIGIDSLTKIRFCEALRNELINQDRATQILAGAFRGVGQEVSSLTKNLIELSTRSHAFAQQLKAGAHPAPSSIPADGEAETISTRLQSAVQRLAQLSATLAAAAPHLEQITNYLRATSDRTSNLYVLGQAYENLVIQLKKYSEPRPDPLPRFATLAEKSHFVDPSRFARTEVETILMDDDVLISMTDLSGRITFANDTFCRLSEYKNIELIGSPHNIIRHPDMPKGVFADLWKDLRAGKMWQGCVKNRSKTGRYYWVMAAVFPHYRDEEIVGYISVRVRPDPAQLPGVIEVYRRIP